MTTNRIFSNPYPQYLKQDGAANALGKIYFYEPGVGNTTEKAAYSDVGYSNALANPLILDSSGFSSSHIYLNGDYRIVIKTDLDVTIIDIPQYQAPELSAQFQSWRADVTYSLNDYVQGSDGEYYESIASNNLGVDPVGNTTNWQRAFITQYSDWISTYTYDVNDFVRGSNGKYYQSLTASNLGNDPTTSVANWVEIYFIDVWNTNKTYGLDEIVKYGDSMYVSLNASNQGNQPDTSTTFWKNFFEASEGTFTGALDGVTTPVTGTVNYKVSGDIVSLWVNADITGTSNTTSLTLDGLPSELRPSSVNASACTNISDNGVSCYGKARIGDIIQFDLAQDNGSNRIVDTTFTASGVKGLLNGWMITYQR